MGRTPENRQDIGYGQGITNKQWVEIKDWWTTQIVLNYKDWTQTQVEEGAEFLRNNRADVLDLLRAKLAADTRLVIVGMNQHPNFDHLPYELIARIPNLDFIAVEARSPQDNTRAFKEDKEGLATVDLGRGVRVDLPHEEAKRLYPDKYKEPDRRNAMYDGVVATVEYMGLNVLFTGKGDTWKDMNRLGADEIASYMDQYSDSRGIFFSSIYSALKWPGYKTKDEQKKIGFGRPLATAHMFSTDPRTDTSVRMPAFALEERFPGQVYSTAQFIMPRGFGAEWKNLRSSVTESRIQDRFALDNVASTPFAIQRQIFVGLAELSDTPHEKLWKYFGTMAQGFFGPAEVRWDKVLDGVIIYPSDQPLPKSPSIDQLMEAASIHIRKIIK